MLNRPHFLGEGLAQKLAQLHRATGLARGL